MDLFRISRKSTRELFDYVSDLLEGERSLFGEEATAQEEVVFEARSDIESLLSFRVQARSEKQKQQQVFQKFSDYFEAGFLIERKGNDWLLKNMFLYGKKFVAPENSIVPFNLPEVPEGGVVRGRSAAVLKAFELSGIARLRDSHAFLFDVSGDTIFLLLSEKPYPWLDELIRKARTTLTVLIGQKLK